MIIHTKYKKLLEQKTCTNKKIKRKKNPKVIIINKGQKGIMAIAKDV